MTDKFALLANVSIGRDSVMLLHGHVILSTRHVVLSLVHGVVLSTCHVMFWAYPIRKSWTGLWTLDPGLGTSPPNKKML